MRQIICSLFFSLFCLGLLTACGESEYSGKQTMEDGTEVSYQTDGDAGRMKFESEEEGTTEMAWGEGAEVSEAFPDDVPVYPGLKVIAAAENAQLGHFSLQGSSEDTPDEVLKFYREQAEAAGWKLSRSQAVSNMQSLSYEKDQRVMAINVMPGQQGMGQAIVSVVTQKTEG